MNKRQYNQHLPTYKHDFLVFSWNICESDHYMYHYSPKSEAERDLEKIIKRQEVGYKKIIEFLDIEPTPDKIKYYFYPDSTTKKQLMGDDWYAQAIINEQVVHVLYTDVIKPLGEHEDTHILATAWGYPISLWQEGLAEFMAGHDWNGLPFYVKAQEAMLKGLAPNLESLMDQDGWQLLDDSYAQYNYASLGSFTTYLIHRYGKERFRRLYNASLRENSAEENLKIFSDIYNKELLLIEGEWKGRLLKKQ